MNEPRAIFGVYGVVFFASLVWVALRVRGQIGYSPIVIHRRPWKESLGAWMLLIYPAFMIAATWLPAFPGAHHEILAMVGAGVLLLGWVFFLLSCRALGPSWRVGIDPDIPDGALYPRNIRLDPPPDLLELDPALRRGFSGLSVLAGAPGDRRHRARRLCPGAPGRGVSPRKIRIGVRGLSGENRAVRLAIEGRTRAVLAAAEHDQSQLFR